MENLDGYGLVILPDCHVLTDTQADALSSFADAGGGILIFGRAAEKNGGWLRRMTGKKTVSYCPDDVSKTAALSRFTTVFEKAYSGFWQLRVDSPRVGVQPHLSAAGLTIHLLNYQYSREIDRVVPIETCTLNLHKTEFPQVKSPRAVQVHTLDGNPVRHSLETAGDVVTVMINDLPLYTAVSFLSERG